MPKKLTQDEWLAKAKAAHGEKYDYSRVEYRVSTDKVTIICPVHGEFQQVASAHSYGAGCKACANDALPQKMSDTGEVFIAKAIAVHGYQYDYSQVDYTHSHKEVEILCNIHGPFMQQPRNHLFGNGCPACGYAGRDLLLSQEDYLASLPATHRETYDYSKMVYRGAREKIDIICRACGNEFTQSANLHQQGGGCPTCALANRSGRTFEVKELPSKEEILEKYDYCPADGTLRYRADLKAVKKGQIAGAINAGGYRALEHCGTVYLVHRIIAMLEGLNIAADTEVDHLNGVTDDNRISNLRVVYRVDNCRNQRLPKNNTTGYPNVRKVGNKFVVYIGYNNENIHRGLYGTLEEAVAARKLAEEEYGYHPNHGKPPEVRAKYSEEE